MNLFLHFIQPISNFMAEVLVNGLAFSAILFCWAFGFVLLKRRWSAATRHRVWLLVFIALALTPVLSFLKLTFPVADAVLYRNGLLPGPAHPDPAEADPVVVIPKQNNTVDFLKAPTAPAGRIDFDWAGAVDWPVVISAIWATFTLGYLLRLIAAIRSIWQLHTSARPLKSPHPVRGQTRRKFQLAESDHISAPMAIGLWAPKILVPTGFCDRLSEDEFVQIVLHEIGHVERNDDWSNLIVQVLAALNPLNPFLWLASRSLDLAREMACDDWVVAGGIGSKEYANLLARLASKETWAPVLASGVVREGNQLFKRVERILDRGCDRKLRPSWFISFLMSAGLFGLAVTAFLLFPAFVVPRTEAAESIESRAGSESGQDRRPDLVVPADPEVISVLKQAAKSDTDPRVRREAVRSLLRLGGDDATGALAELLEQSNDTETRLFILRNLTRKQCASPAMQAELSQLAEKGQPEMVKILALEQLGRTNDPGAVDKLIAIYKSSDGTELKRACLRSLAQLATKPAKEFLMEMAKSDPDPSVRSEALRMLVDGARRPPRVIIRAPGVMLEGEDSPFGQDLDSDFPEDLGPGLRDRLNDLDARTNGLFIKTRKLRDRFYLEEPGQLPAPELPPPAVRPPLPPTPPPAREQQPSLSNPMPTPNEAR